MLLALIAIPTVFIMMVWVLVTAYRILRPEKPLPLEHDPFLREIRAYEFAEPIAVGARMIKAQDKRYQRVQSLESPYDYLEGYSEGFPEGWLDDVYRRRN